MDVPATEEPHIGPSATISVLPLACTKKDAPTNPVTAFRYPGPMESHRDPQYTPFAKPAVARVREPGELF